MKQLTKTLKATALLVAILLLGCVNDDNENLPKVTAKFTYTVDVKTGTVTFLNVSENATSYVWNFGDETTSTLINPVHVYATGEYTVVLTASHQSGASDTFQDVITITVPEPVALPITFDETNVTYNDVVAFNGASFEVVANPDTSGANPEASNVGKITNSGVAYEGFFYSLATAIDFNTNNAISFDFWADQAVDILIKLEDGTAPDLEVIVSHTGAGWETLEAIFSSTASYKKVTVFVDGAGTTAGVFYIDNIMQTTAVITCEPKAPAAMPMHDAANVMAVYSDAYTNIAGTDLNPNWGQATAFSEVTIVGEDAILYENFNYQGIQLGSLQDVSQMTYLHIDYWACDADALRVFIIDASGNEFPISLTVPTDGTTWASVDIPLADFTSGNSSINLLEIAQLKFDKDASTISPSIYLDNIYFYTLSSAASPTVSAPVPTQSAANVVSIYSDTYTSISGIDYDPNWGQSGYTLVNPAFDPGDGNLVLAYPTFTYQGTDFSGNPQDLSTMKYLHVDIWVPTGTDRLVKISPINTGSGATEFLVVVPITPGAWNSVDLPIADFTGMTWDAVTQIKFDAQFNGDGSANTTPFDVYIDNLYFYKN